MNYSKPKLVIALKSKNKILVKWTQPKLVAIGFPLRVSKEFVENLPRREAVRINGPKALTRFLRSHNVLPWYYGYGFKDDNSNVAFYYPYLFNYIAKFARAFYHWFL